MLDTLDVHGRGGGFLKSENAGQRGEDGAENQCFFRKSLVDGRLRVCARTNLCRKRSENDKWQLSKIWGIYMWELGNIFLFCRIYLRELENIWKFCEFNLFKAISYEHKVSS